MKREQRIPTTVLLSPCTDAKEVVLRNCGRGVEGNGDRWSLRLGVLRWKGLNLGFKVWDFGVQGCGFGVVDFKV